VDIAGQEAGDYRAIQIWNGDWPIAMVSNPRNRGKDTLPNHPPGAGRDFG
jgi:hypothetical protein